MLLKLAESLAVGVSIAAIPGPIFFELIRRTLSRDFYSGLALVLGEFSGNFLVLLIVFFGVSHFLTNTPAKIVFYILGAVTLLLISASALKLKENDVPAFYKIRPAKTSKESFLAGFSIAVSSPIVIALWISLSGSYLNVLSSKLLAFLNILFIAIGFLLFFAPLAFIIYKTRHRISSRYVVLLSKTFGVVLAIYGLLLVIGAVRLLLAQ